MTEAAPAFLDRKLIEQARIYTRVEADAGRYSNIDDARAKYVAAGNDGVVAAIDQELVAIEKEASEPPHPLVVAVVIIAAVCVLGGAGYMALSPLARPLSVFTG